MSRGLRQTAFTRLLDRSGPVLLDGGLATQLEAQGCDIKGDLWSAGLLRSDPDAIVAAHRAYIDAGAQCIATASYQASQEGFAALGLSAEEADSLMLFSVELAQRARDAAGSDAAIAASMGPYGAMLNDGSEYSGNYAVSADVLRKFHRTRLQLFDASGVDVLGFETIPSLCETEVLAELLQNCSTPAWVSFSCRDDRCISDGTPLAEIAKLFSGHPTVLALGINCTAPLYMPPLLRELRQAAPDKHGMAYPNSGETYNADDGSWSGTVTPLDYSDAAQEWVVAGAKIVGGCCRVGPDHIRAMASVLGQQAG